MSSGLTAVHAVLGSSTPITDREIRSALWDSYFDVDGTVAYLLGAFASVESLSEWKQLTKDSNRRTTQEGGGKGSR